KVGSPGRRFAISLVKIGWAPASLDNLASRSSPSSRSSDRGAALGVGESCAISVSFEPTAAGQVNATLSFETDATANTTSIALSGTGLDRASARIPTTLAFGANHVGHTTGPLAITLANNGTAPATLAAPTSSDPASLHDALPSSALAVGESCAISVSFEPTAAGQVNATLSFETDATANATSIALSGTGLDRKRVVNGTRLDRCASQDGYNCELWGITSTKKRATHE